MIIGINKNSFYYELHFFVSAAININKMQTKPICDYPIFVIKRGIYKNCSRKTNELTIAIPPRERPCFRRRPRMSPSFCFAFSTTATAISTTLVDFPSAHPLPLRTIQRPSFFRAGCCGAREMNRGTPMDFFFRTARTPALPRTPRSQCFKGCSNAWQWS